MKNVIAVIWDCDKTLIDGYMQDPMFAEYGVETKQFWADENKILDEYQKTGVRVNRDTYYLNYFIKCAHEGIFPAPHNVYACLFIMEGKWRSCSLIVKNAGKHCILRHLLLYRPG